MEVTGPRLTRRDMLKLSLLGGAALALPIERSARTQLMIADRVPEGQLPEPFRVPFASPLSCVRSTPTPRPTTTG